MEKKRNTWVRITFFVLLIAFFISIINLQSQMQELKEKKEKLQEEILILKDDIEELQQLLAAEKNDEYYARVARNKLNYHFPNEIIFYNDFAQ